MPCYTYLSDGMYKCPLKNQDLQAVLEETINLTGFDWRVCEIEWTTGSLWWKKKRYHYQLFVGSPNGFGEFECVNFPPAEPEEWGRINFYTHAAVVESYLNGVLTGMNVSSLIRGHCKHGSNN